MQILVTGWFSFDVGHTTAGDLLAKDVVCGWLREAGYDYHVAATVPFVGDVEWFSADPSSYTHVVFVCGPFRPGSPLAEFLDHFAGCRIIGINLSMLEPVNVWNPFDFLIERDSTERSRPDLTFLSPQITIPVIGVALVHPQSEYGSKQRHSNINRAVQELIAGRDVAVVQIDTRLDNNSVGLRSANQVEGLISRMDLIVTTRLHGLVLALKNGVPAVAIDPISGGAKIKQQANTIGWPVVFTPETVTHRALQGAFDFCLTQDARKLATQCRDGAHKRVASVKQCFLDAIQAPRRGTASSTP